MKTRHWFLVLSVGIIVSVTESRPQTNEEHRHIYPVYRADRELDDVRYCKNKTLPNQRLKRETRVLKKDGKEYVEVERLGLNRTAHMLKKILPNSAVISNEKTEIKNNSRSSNVHFIPISSSNGVKDWPSGQNGIQSLDELILYNTYTENNKKPIGSKYQIVQSSQKYQNLQTTPSSYYNQNYHNTQNYHNNYPYYTQNKPSIIIIEELTTRPTYDSYDDHSIQPQPSNYNQIVTYKPSGTVATPSMYPPSNKPVYSVTPTVYINPPTKRPKRTKKPNCANVVITASSSVSNNNNINKEGDACNDININIHTTLDNSNNGSFLTGSSPGMQNDPVPGSGSHPTIQVQQPVFSVFNRPQRPTTLHDPMSDTILSMFGLIGSASWNPLTWPFWTTVFAPMAIVIAGGIGLAAFIFPNTFPGLLFRRRRRNRFRNGNRVIVLRNRMDQPRTYEYNEVDKNSMYLKRTKRDMNIILGYSDDYEDIVHYSHTFKNSSPRLTDAELDDIVNYLLKYINNDVKLLENFSDWWRDKDNT